MTFSDDLFRFAAKADARGRAVFLNTASAVKDSITDGSAVTGSPGQPVGQYGPGYHKGKVGGTLKASWQLWFDTPETAVIATDTIYAPPIEDGIGKYGPLTLRSTVGGFHSVKMTVAGFERIVDAELKKLGDT